MNWSWKYVGSNDLVATQSLAQLTDVNLSTPVLNDVLQYNGTQWENVQISNPSNPPRLLSFSYFTDGNTTMGITVSPRIANRYYCSTNLYTSVDHKKIELNPPVDLFYSTVSSPNIVAGDIRLKTDAPSGLYLITFLYLDTGLANDDFGFYKHIDGDNVDTVEQLWSQRTSST